MSADAQWAMRILIRVIAVLLSGRSLAGRHRPSTAGAVFPGRCRTR
jgi:hypothetical protein